MSWQEMLAVMRWSQWQSGSSGVLPNGLGSESSSDKWGKGS